MIALEQLQHVLVDRLPPEVVARAELGEEVRGKIADVLQALAQRRHPNRDDAEAVVQVLAELAVGDPVLEDAVRGGDHPNRDADRLLAAEPLHLAVLQHAQQLGLRRLVQVADLVEEDCAAVGQLELAAPHAGGAGECAALVAEQLALDQLGGNRRAVDFDERARGERALAMDVRGQQFLARP